MSDQRLISHPFERDGDRLGFIVHFDFKVRWEEERAKSGLVDFIDEMIQEPTFVNFFRLRDRTNRNRIALYETWRCSREYFLNVEMRRAYRAQYERLLPSLVKTPREMQMDWRLVRSDSRPLDLVSDGGNQYAFFVHFNVKPNKEKEFRLLIDDLLECMSRESSFINYFLLQDGNDLTRFVVYETWWGTAEDFTRTETARAYRRRYEEAVPELLTKPRELEQNWQLLYAVDRGTSFR